MCLCMRNEEYHSVFCAQQLVSSSSFSVSTCGECFHVQHMVVLYST